MPPTATPVARWPWLAGGAAISFALAGWVLWRNRRRTAPEPVIAARLDPVDPPRPAPPPRPRDRAIPDSDTSPFAVRVAAGQLRFAETELRFELELEITNTRPQRAEALRPALALISAHPGQDRDIAAFHGASAGMAQAEAFDLAPGAVLRLPVRMVLPRSRIHTVSLRGRPMFVALLMLDLRWRAGLSIRRSGTDFLIGSAGASDKPGPIWLDRPAPAALAATAYRPAAL